MRVMKREGWMSQRIWDSLKEQEVEILGAAVPGDHVRVRILSGKYAGQTTHLNKDTVMSSCPMESGT